MSCDGHACFEPEWRYVVLRRRSPLDSAGSAPCFTLHAGDVWRQKVTHETDDLELRSKLIEEWNNGDGSLPHYPKRSDWSVEVVRNGPALGVGGGSTWS